jgi:hypothetical protein
LFHILDGREHFYQWDKDRKLVVGSNSITEVHFANCLCPNARVCEVKTGEGGIRLVDVPNELLTEYLDIKVWGYDSGMTKHEQVFEVEKRPKPADYVYTQTEVWTAEKAVADALEEAKASGEFKGEKGDKGEPGAVKFIVVWELPATGDTDAIYLLSTKDGTADNQYDEYIFVNGYWECIGSTSVDVNLDGYVKKTDYANEGKSAGIVRIDKGTGIAVRNDGTIYLPTVSFDDIFDKKAVQYPLKVQNIDDVIVAGLTNNDLELSEVERYRALNWLGAVGKDDYATEQKPGVVKLGTGMSMTSDGRIQVVYASEANIIAKNSYRNAITPINLDFAVKTSITTNTIPLTEDEKKTALTWLGVYDLLPPNGDEVSY